MDRTVWKRRGEGSVPSERRGREDARNHQASTTHAQLTPEEEQREAGVSPDLLRLSVGIEDPADILADIDAGIEAAE